MTGNQAGEVNNEPTRQNASARVVVLALVSFAAGLTAGSVWFSRPAPAQAVVQTAPAVTAEDRVAESPPIHGVDRPGSRMQAPDPGAIQIIKNVIPNLDETSEETGTVMLRKAAVVEFEIAARAFCKEQKKMEEEISKLPENERKAAAKRLLDMQAAQAMKLKRIAADSRSQIQALQSFKARAQ